MMVSHTHRQEVAAYEQLGGRGEDPYPKQVKDIDKVAQAVPLQHGLQIDPWRGGDSTHSKRK
jgi:hypothetical protein